MFFLFESIKITFTFNLIYKMWCCQYSCWDKKGFMHLALFTQQPSELTFNVTRDENLANWVD